MLAFAGAAAGNDGCVLEDLEGAIRARTLAAADRDPSRLQRDAALREIARAHSRDMYENRFLSHESSAGLGSAERVHRGHRTLFGLVSENVAYQENWPAEPPLADRFVRGWMRSTGHRRNILAEYDAFEVGCHGRTTGSPRRAYCAQLFAASVQRLAQPVAYVQAPGATIRIRLERPTAGNIAEMRVGLAESRELERTAPLVPEGNRLGTRLTLPHQPGSHQLSLWTSSRGDPLRYVIVPGPVICIGSRNTCPSS